jgi:hypothetical protein
MINVKKALHDVNGFVPDVRPCPEEPVESEIEDSSLP